MARVCVHECVKYVCISTRECACTHARLCARVSEHMSVRLRLCMQECAYVYGSVRTCMVVYVRVSLCIREDPSSVRACIAVKKGTVIFQLSKAS